MTPTRSSETRRRNSASVAGLAGRIFSAAPPAPTSRPRGAAEERRVGGGLGGRNLLAVPRRLHLAVDHVAQRFGGATGYRKHGERRNGKRQPSGKEHGYSRIGGKSQFRRAGVSAGPTKA